MQSDLCYHGVVKRMDSVVLHLVPVNGASGVYNNWRQYDHSVVPE